MFKVSLSMGDGYAQLNFVGDGCWGNITPATGEYYVRGELVGNSERVYHDPLDDEAGYSLIEQGIGFVDLIDTLLEGGVLA